MALSRQEDWSGCCALLQGIFLTRELNWGLLHYRWILYQLSYLGSPRHVYMCLVTQWTPKICICIYVLILSIWLDHRVPRYWVNINCYVSGSVSKWSEHLSDRLSEVVCPPQCLWTSSNALNAWTECTPSSVIASAERSVFRPWNSWFSGLWTQAELHHRFQLADVRSWER